MPITIDLVQGLVLGLGIGAGATYCIMQSAIDDYRRRLADRDQELVDVRRYMKRARGWIENASKDLSV
jgi:hypothetical protein